MRATIATVCLAALSTTSAFVQRAPVKMSAAPKVMSKSLPFKALINNPETGKPLLDGALPGDVGFDPAGFATSPELLLSYRDAEIKHGRLAMLAAVGWPISELLNGKLAALFHLPNTLAKNGMAPNVLNGAIFNEAFLGSLLGGLGLAAVIELKTLADGQQRTMGGGVKLAEVEREIGRKYQPGNLGFDPLGLGGKDEAARKRMELAEIKHCRLAMIAVSAFVFQELASGLPVTAETPFLFKPFFL